MNRSSRQDRRFLSSYYGKPSRPSAITCRTGELKAAGMVWTEVLELEEDNGRARLAAEILASDAYQTTMDKVRAFVQRGGGCRATYFNHVRRLNGAARASRRKGVGRDCLPEVFACAVQRRGSSVGATPTRQLVAPAGSNRSDCGGNEAVEAFGGKGRSATPRASRP